jgi:hypothetical protein
MLKLSWMAGVCFLLAMGAGCGGGVGSRPLEMSFQPPPDPMPILGSSVSFSVGVEGGEAPDIQWFKDEQPLPGEKGGTLVLNPVSPLDAGAYQVKVTDGATRLASESFIMEPAEAVWLVSTEADAGPGSLREALKECADYPGVAGIQFAIPGEGPVTLHLESPLEPIRAKGTVVVLGPRERPLTLDGGGLHRPFFLAEGTLVLDNFTLANGLGKGGDGLGGGGGAAGMGGAIFQLDGHLLARRMTFRGNRALGGAGLPGGNGENGGGGGFGGDSPSQGGRGADGGFLGGEGGVGFLDGTTDDGVGGWGSGLGAGGGATRGGDLALPLELWAENHPGGDASWGGGGGFSVGPMGGGGNGSDFGGGGGGSGGHGYLGALLMGGSESEGGEFGGGGTMGDGVIPGQGGGGGGLGGALFLRGGTLDLLACRFEENQALGGRGGYDGDGKGGAVFIYPYDWGTPERMDMLKAQRFRGNFASDALVEGDEMDNHDYFVAHRLLAFRKGSAMDLLYRRRRLEKKLGWPVRPSVP